MGILGSGASLTGLPPAGNLGGVFSGVGGAVSDLFAAQGDTAEAQQDTLASQYAAQEAQFTTDAANVTRTQAHRQILQAVGTEKAGYAGSGLTLGGSAGDVLRSSAQQGALTKATITNQAAETSLGYTEQSQSYASMAAAAQNAASGATIGAGLSGLGAIANLAMLPI